MLPSLPLRLTREGIYYFCVLLFVIAGAVVKELNLLVMLAGMLVAPLVLQARTVCISLRRLHFSRRMPDRVGAGEAFHLRLTVANARPFMASWLLVVRDRVHVVGRPAREGSEVEVRLPYVAPHSQETVSYRLCLTTRGLHEFGPIQVSTRFPLGLMVARRKHLVRDTLLVFPRMGRMTQAWVRLMHGDRAGNLASRGRKGLTEAEFYGLREWRPGDSQRWVHWRTSARLSEPVVRQFEQQPKAEVGMLVDLWLPPSPTEQQKLELEVAISFAASAIAELGREGNARVTVVLSQDSLVCWTGLATSALADEILTQLALASGGESPWADGLDELAQRVPHQGRLAVISTRDQPTGEGNGHDESAATRLPTRGRAAEVHWIRALRDLKQYVAYSDASNGAERPFDSVNLPDPKPEKQHARSKASEAKNK
jgi:uncharacterized protein (DUF58 family)